MKKLLITTLFFISTFINSYSDETKMQTDLEIGEKIKILDKTKHYDARIYFFTDIATCEIYNYNFSVIQDYLKDYNIEYAIFINKLNQEESDSLKSKYEWNFKAISDEYGVYKLFYKIKMLPFMLILDNNGKVTHLSPVTGKDVKLKDLKKVVEENLIAFENNTLDKHIKEIKRIKVLDQGKPVKTDILKRHGLYSKARNEFYLRHNWNCSLFVVDSIGNIIKTINENNYPNINCSHGYDISWAAEDSIIFLYNSYRVNKFTIYNYNIIEDTVSTPLIFQPYITENSNFGSFTSSFFNNTFILSFCNATNNNYTLNENDTIYFLYNNLGDFIKGFDKPNKYILKYKSSSWFSPAFTISNDFIITFQNFDSEIKYWDLNGNFIKSFHLNMGENYRFINKDVSNSLTSKETAYIWNNYSELLKMLYDKDNKLCLISYRNTTYPPGIYDFFSDEVTLDVFLVISDSNGKQLNEKEIKVPGSFIPFCFDDSLIYGTELNDNRELEIVVYKFIP